MDDPLTSCCMVCQGRGPIKTYHVRSWLKIALDEISKEGGTTTHDNDAYCYYGMILNWWPKAVQTFKRSIVSEQIGNSYIEDPGLYHKNDLKDIMVNEADKNLGLAILDFIAM